MSLTFQRLARSKVAAATLPRTLGRRFLAATANPTLLPKKLSSSSIRPFCGSKRMAQIGAVGLVLGAAQYRLGTSEHVFEHKFITSKTPEDLADFYGTEDFMEIFCVLPFMVDLMMRGAEFDDDGTIHAWGLLGPGELQVSIDFEEREIDTNGDGEPDTLAWFNKKEHFHDVAPSFLGGFTLWDFTQNFGYHRLEDGTCEVYHSGEKFHGFFPIRLLFQLHAKYVIWATEKYINNNAFGSEDREEDLEEQRQNIPLHVFKSFLEGLTQDVERAKEDSKADPKKREELEVTLGRLETITNNMDHTTSSLPRLRTLRSHKTNVAHTHLMVDDKETKDTIRTAVMQIGSTKGHRHEPASEMLELTRRTTLHSRKTQRNQNNNDADNQ